MAVFHSVEFQPPRRYFYLFLSTLCIPPLRSPLTQSPLAQRHVRYVLIYSDNHQTFTPFLHWVELPIALLLYLLSFHRIPRSR